MECSRVAGGIRFQIGSRKEDARIANTDSGKLRRAVFIFPVPPNPLYEIEDLIKKIEHLSLSYRAETASGFALQFVLLARTVSHV
jgi:hypothetical protein